MEEFLRQLWEFLTYALPRPVWVEPNEGGVLLRFGKFKYIVETGWTWVWPPIEKVRKLDITEQVIDLRAQSLTTKDDATLAVSGAVSYRVENPKKALLDVQDVDVSLPTLSLGILAHYVTTHTLEECMNCEEIVDHVRKGIRDEAVARWGLRILKVWITDIAEHKVIRVIGGGDMQYVPQVEEE